MTTSNDAKLDMPTFAPLSWLFGQQRVLMVLCLLGLMVIFGHIAGIFGALLVLAGAGVVIGVAKVEARPFGNRRYRRTNPPEAHDWALGEAA